MSYPRSCPHPISDSRDMLSLCCFLDRDEVSRAESLKLRLEGMTPLNETLRVGVESYGLCLNKPNLVTQNMSELND